MSTLTELAKKEAEAKAKAAKKKTTKTTK